MALSPDSPDQAQPVAQSVLQNHHTKITTTTIGTNYGSTSCENNTHNNTKKQLNIDTISQSLIDKLCAIKFDINSVAHLLELCCKALETCDHSRISIRTKHRLCMSLSICYFSLLEYESDNFPEILSYIRISLTCMSLIKQSSVASHILCRALLERSVVYGHLFNKNFDPYSVCERGESNSMKDWTSGMDNIKLSKENLKVTLGHRFRRLPNHKSEHTAKITNQNSVDSTTSIRSITATSLGTTNTTTTTASPTIITNGVSDKRSRTTTTANGSTKTSNNKRNNKLSKAIDIGTNLEVQEASDVTSSSGTSSESEVPDKQSINSYLLIEAFKSSINNMEDFANLFVEFHCPVMFDKLVWSSDDALRVINEKNLSILRKFEQIPPLWDLYELIGQAGCLKNCLVLVKALTAALLAIWSSATTNSCPDRTSSTSRLIPPLAQSGLLPKAFGLAVDVFPHLEPSEVFSVLNDIWQYLKDTNLNLTNGQSRESNLSEEDKLRRAKPYLNRLRLFMSQNIPGPLYVKIFKDFYTPTTNSVASAQTSE